MADMIPERIRMTAEEFMALPETNVPHELIDGELIVSPTPKHPHQQLVFKLAKYIEQLAPAVKSSSHRWKFTLTMATLSSRTSSG